MEGNWIDRWAARRLTRLLRSWWVNSEPTADQLTAMSFLWLARGDEHKAELCAIRAAARRNAAK